ncbi:MAG TPA: glutathione S-transferase N-terminal domain-containing protein [Solirubrobacteraceae bacterium]|nr:glutathione S-transferase N-terminal domain-containing protein [Solirubrobacteraceae bacterium]
MARAALMLRLVTIPISHYCEKARWSLERAALDYREERHVQGIHRLAARRAGGGSTVPVLVTPERSIGESQQILEWVDERLPDERRLFPREQRLREDVERLCSRFDDALGPSARRLIYVHMLRDRPLALRFNNDGVPPWEERTLRRGWPAFELLIKRALAIDADSERADELIVWRELDFAAELLADGRAHLCGERFTAADVTFAALAAAVIVPPQYGVTLPQPAQMRPPTAALVERAREHPAGAYALSLFARRRDGER